VAPVRCADVIEKASFIQRSAVRSLLAVHAGSPQTQRRATNKIGFGNLRKDDRSL